MSDIFKSMADNPGAAIPIAIISLAVNVWLATQWTKSMGQVFEFANKFGGAIAATNERLVKIELLLDRVDRRGD